LQHSTKLLELSKMALEKKRANKRTRKGSVPIGETVLEDVTYTNNTTSMVTKNDYQDGGRVGNITTDVKGKQRGRRSKANSNVASSSNIGSVTQTTRGQTTGKSSNSTNTRSPYSTKTGGQQYFEEEADEGEEEDEDEDDEGEVYEEDEEDDVEVKSEHQNLLNKSNPLNYDGKNYAIDVNAMKETEFENYNCEDQEHAYAISVDHNVLMHNTERPPIGTVVASTDFYKSLAKSRPSNEATGSYAPSFSPPRYQQTTNTSSVGSGTSAFMPSQMQSSTSGRKQPTINNPDPRISPCSTGIQASLSVNAEGSFKINSSSSSIGIGSMTSQLGTMTNHTSPIQKMYQTSPSQMSQPSQKHSSTPISINSGKDPLRPKLIAYYTDAMNALESVTPDIQTKLGYEQANTAINALLDETTSYYKAVYMGNVLALKPPSSAKESFADSILKSGNLLGEYKVMFREYEAAVTSQTLASAQLKHALAHKHLIESKLLHVKNRLQQIQFDAGK